MQAVAVDVYVSVSVCWLYCAKMAEPLEMPFVMLTRMDTRNHTFDGGTYVRHLANIIE